MHLLIRRVNPYSGADLLLGVFPSLAQAEAAKQTYVAGFAAEIDADPGRERMYKEPGQLAADLSVEELLFEAGEHREVYVVSKFSEGLGQIIRCFDSLHSSEVAAAARAAEIDRTQEEESWPWYAQTQRIPVGVLLPDMADEPLWRFGA